MAGKFKKLFRGIWSQEHQPTGVVLASRPAVVCYGRDELCERIIRSFREQGCVLLFGGRQSGKSTVLRAIAQRAEPTGTSGEVFWLPVYVDLMRLPYDADPWIFFGMLRDCAIQSCMAAIPRFRPGNSRLTIRSVSAFENEILQARASATGMDLRIAFLLDESKRVIGNRFPRGFHDNLFHLLYGDSKLAGLCSIVFAGAQELYRLCEDDTSPIGSRAAKQCVTNLLPATIRHVAETLLEPGSADTAEIAEEVYKWTGGHAGLSSGLIRSVCNISRTRGDRKGIVDAAAVLFRRERSELFQLWSSGLSGDARPVHDGLLRNGRLDRAEIADALRRANVAVHRIDRIVDELQYVGIAVVEGSTVVANNKLYMDQACFYADEERGSDSERSVWSLIEETEIGLRRVVRRQFELKWRAAADQMMQNALGGETWQTILDNKDKYLRAHANGVDAAQASEILNFAYLGQLLTLIIWRKSWALFSHMFRDKRELEDMLADIVPVRNERAHFRRVPEHDLDKCSVRCVDLLAILERTEP